MKIEKEIKKLINDNILYFDSEEELKKMSVNRLFVLQKRCLQLLEHYIVNDLYDENDYIMEISDIYKINIIIKEKLETIKGTR